MRYFFNIRDVKYFPFRVQKIIATFYSWNYKKKYKQTNPLILRWLGLTHMLRFHWGSGFNFSGANIIQITVFVHVKSMWVKYSYNKRIINITDAVHLRKLVPKMQCLTAFIDRLVVNSHFMLALYIDVWKAIIILGMYHDIVWYPIAK